MYAQCVAFILATLYNGGEVFKMAKTANLNIRIDPDIKRDV